MAAEIARTVDCVIHLEVFNDGGMRRRRLASVGVVDVAASGGVRSLAAALDEGLPPRMAAALAKVGYDAARIREAVDG